MHSDRGMLCTQKWSDGKSMRPDNHNTLTRRCANMNDASIGALHSPVKKVTKNRNISIYVALSKVVITKKQKTKKTYVTRKCFLY